MVLKAVILIGGPQKGTRFRPLSFDLPKPLFPVAGRPMVEHLIAACAQVPEMREIYLMGFYHLDDSLTQFIENVSRQFAPRGIAIKYLQEYTSLDTAGGVFHFRDKFRRGSPEGFFILNGDICGTLPLEEMVKCHRALSSQSTDLNSGGKSSSHAKPLVTMLTTGATRQQATEYGCVVQSPLSINGRVSGTGSRSVDVENLNEIRHYVEKPETFISTEINCGVYFCSPAIFGFMSTVYQEKSDLLIATTGPATDPASRTSFVENMELAGSSGPGSPNGSLSSPSSVTPSSHGGEPDALSLEFDILPRLAGSGSGQLYGYHTDQWWSTIKTAASAIYANRHYLRANAMELADGGDMSVTDPMDQSQAKGSHGPKIIGDVFVHPTAKIDSTSTIGPNVSIGEGVTIGAGVRIRESIVLRDAIIADQSLVRYTIIGWSCSLGEWCRVEGTPTCDPDPDRPYTKIDNLPLFNRDGKLNPSITVLGSSVHVPAETMILNSIVLPHKEIARNYKNEIIL